MDQDLLRTSVAWPTTLYSVATGRAWFFCESNLYKMTGVMLFLLHAPAKSAQEEG